MKPSELYEEMTIRSEICGAIRASRVILTSVAGKYATNEEWRVSYLYPIIANLQDAEKMTGFDSVFRRMTEEDLLERMMEESDAEGDDESKGRDA